jgi:hypothetical protein
MNTVHPFVTPAHLPILYDIRCDPSTARFLLSSPYYHCTFHDLVVPITDSHPRFIRVISTQLPWVIDIGKRHPVTCSDVLTSLYDFLQAKLTEQEWKMADKEARERIMRARKRRVKAGEGGTLKRVDWLGGRSMFLGLEKDEDFAKLKLRSDYRKVRETWVVIFGRP